ncbi:MAG: 2-phosphosulfolactate phosphatase [Anaerolineae bacterium]|nr:2-phosphosulfolactate phosphatase [Anaerolineae bacterium]
MVTIPRIERYSLLEGARRARGLAVVIDVYRAFTSAAFMFHLGASEIILLTDPNDVLRLKRDEGCLAVGEVDGRRVEGFDLGNSPAAVLAAGGGTFAGRRVAQRTSAGVLGAVAAARGADAVLLGSYVTASATARYVRALSPPPEFVSLVAMGAGGLARSPEDEACAAYLAHLLAGEAYDHLAAIEEIATHEATSKFLRGDQPHYPREDPLYCLQRDLFDFVLLALTEGDRVVAHRVAV